jgi:class 3 adenylate cyclase
VNSLLLLSVTLPLLAAVVALAGALISAKRRLAAETGRLSARIAETAEESSRQIQTFARIGTVISSSFDRGRLLSQILLILADYWPSCAVRLLVYRKDGTLERIGSATATSGGETVPVRPSDENLMSLIATASGGRRNPEWELFLDGNALLDYAYNFPFVAEERFMGTLVILSRTPLERRDRLFLGDVASLIASAHQNVLTRREKDIINERFGKSVDPRVRDVLLSSSEEGRILEVSVLFLDIRGFTALSERLGPTETVRFLNGVFTACETVVHGEGGFINKFTGDGFMAVFGAPTGTDTHPGDAVRAARRIVAELADVPVGIGIATGPALAGTIGSESRLEYTVIGDTVNTAARIEGLCKVFGASILATGATVEHSGEAVGESRFLGTLRLKGKSSSIRAYEILEGNAPYGAEYLSRFDGAIAAYFSGNFGEAERAFVGLARDNPSDEAGAWYLARARERLASDDSAPWDGVEQMIVK